MIPLLARTDLPELTHLGLMNAAFTDEICGQLATSVLAPQLRELDLSMGAMSDAGAAALVAAATKLTKLVKLDVSQSYLSDDAIATLRGEFKEVIASDQRGSDTDDDDRYPSVGE